MKLLIKKLLWMHSFMIVLATQAQPFKVTIALQYNNEPTKGVYIAGNFNNWNASNSAYKVNTTNPNKHILFFTTSENKIEFKFTQGDWATVECDENGKDIDNRTATIESDTTLYITVKSFKSSYSVKTSTASERVKILNDSFYIPQLKSYRRVWLYLPKWYDGVKKFPVLYMFDGQNLFDNTTSGFGEWGIDECLDTMAVNCIVVGIDHAGNNRLKEYNPYKSNISQLGQGIGKQFAPFVITLKKYIDKNYKTLSSKQHTFIAGSSMGGLISYYTTVQYSSVFGKAGIFSPSFWINMEAVKKDLSRKKLNRNHFYFYAGTAESNELVSQVMDIASATKNQCTGCNIKLSIKADAKHNEAAWQKELPEFLVWLKKVL